MTPEKGIRYSIVYIYDEKVYGELISYGWYASKVHYSKRGIDYEVMLLNEDFEIVEEVNIEEIEEY